ncbi:MAG: transporter substrate-binding protein [Betaproteobacteria bacterium]|nr:transporter substrate-binding protein [Betaproteobacteria bacterium]
MIGRVLGAKVSASIGQSIVVENRGGAATLIGAENVAKSPPDGYSMLLATSTTLAINPHLYKTLPYDPLKDFIPVTLVARIPMVLVVHPALPAKNARELIALAKQKPDQLTYATQGLGSPADMAMLLFAESAGIKAIAVPYKGGAPGMIDLLAGNVTMMFDNGTAAYVKSGKLRALMQTGEKRAPSAPEIPTAVELGFKNCVFYPWQGVVVPAKTPPEIVARLQTEFRKALQSPDVRDRITFDGAEVIAGSSAEFGEYIKSEFNRFGKIIRATGAQPQ